MHNQIKLCVPFINADNYIKSIIEMAGNTASDRCIYELYGSLPEDPIGNLRPPESVRPMTMEQLAGSIEKLHAHGIRFNYIINSELIPIPMTAEYRDKVMSFLQQLSEAGVDEITVTIPYLIMLIHKYFPNLKVNVSICNEISTVSEAMEFEEVGAEVLVLDRDVNRDFHLLRDIRRHTKGEIKVLCNSACVFHCINVHYHGIYSSALSNSLIAPAGKGENVFRTPCCSFYCRRRFFRDLTELMKLHWIRPEDLPVYAREGIELFKIDGRDKEPDYLLSVVKAYLDGSYEHNLFHLLQPEFCEDLTDIDTEAEASNVPLGEEELAVLTDAFTHESRSWQVGIDNRALNGFIRSFADEKIACRGNCKACGYCKAYAEKILVNPQWRQEMLQMLDHNIQMQL